MATCAVGGEPENVPTVMFAASFTTAETTELPRLDTLKVKLPLAGPCWMTFGVTVKLPVKDTGWTNRHGDVRRLACRP